MGALIEIGNLLIQTLFNFFLVAVILRLLLQLARADFYNPISQFLVKATNPALTPLRRFIPGAFGIDMASLALMLLVQVVATSLLVLLQGYSLPNPLLMILWGALGCIGIIVNIYFIAILAMIIVSWVAPGSHHPIVMLIHQLTEPVMKPFRKLLPPMGGLDLSPIILFLVINVVEILLKHLASTVGLPPAYVLGI